MIRFCTWVSGSQQVQNDLSELHSMVSFVAPQLLGPLGAFKKQVADPIAKVRWRYKNNK